jgi:aryl-alcohol dehydrogenase-like predicted oxidoreductase
MDNRRFGDMELSPLGLGCWAIGGPFWEGDKPLGWGEVNDKESISAIHAGLDAGINLIDTANIYGAGHSEYVVGKAIKHRRDKVIISSKFGFDADEKTKQMKGVFTQPHEIEAMCENSLRRLGTDYLDIYFLHLNDHPIDEVEHIQATLENLVTAGKIRRYGWSTDFADRAQHFSQQDNCSAIQFELNVLSDNPDVLAVCERHNVAGFNRGPLAMGLLGGKYDNGGTLSESDVRKISPDWMKYFHDGVPSPELLKKLGLIREILTSNGRTVSQGALAWLWARSPNNVPIPGFRTVEQSLSNAKAMEFGPLAASQMQEIARLLK